MPRSTGLVAYARSVFGWVSTPAVVSSDAETSIASLEWIELGGVEQAVLLRGRRSTNPVVLFLHGGPGATEMPMVRHHLAALEASFVVVTWDMRGMGRSAGRACRRETLTHARIEADALELIERLCERFGVRRILLAAHSWGTIIGTRIVATRPEWFFGYVGIAQWTDGVRREAESFRLILDWARTSGETRAARQLEAIGAPPWPAAEADRNLEVQKKWLLESGEMIHAASGMGLLLGPLLWASEYSLLDKLRFMPAFMAAMRALWPEAMTIDLTRASLAFEVPMIFVSGAHDFNTPPHLIEEYVQRISAPHKEHVVFGRSAHAPCFEEPERFVALLEALPARFLDPSE